jgi:hypothetical protein
VPLLAVETGVILIIVVLVALPIGAIAFAAGAGDALKQVGRGGLSLEGEPPPREDAFSTMATSQVREEEIRQMVEARSYRAVARGDEALDVDAEVEKLLAPDRTGPGLGADKGLREEIRQLVVARNERRVRQGKEPLDVEAEIERQLEELEGLGQ